ncbi:MAG: DUF7005 family protein [Prochlorococcaceae cyanobacterium]
MRSESFQRYLQGFSQANEPWPTLPLPEEPELLWWRDLLAEGKATPGAQQASGKELLAALSRALPQLQLPQITGISGSELYKQAVLRGEPLSQAVLAAAGPLPQWEQPEALRLWIATHPCGAMPVLHTPSWNDFELLVRALAHRGEPVALADGVHAQAVSGLIHWGLINQLGRQSRARLIVLHEAPYGSVDAMHVPGGMSAGAWLIASTTLRLEHELTHLATKRVLGEMRLNLLDELIADAMGMVAALGCFDAALFGRCLGVDVGNNDRPIANGRWISYTQELSDTEASSAVHLVMARARELEATFSKQLELLAPELAMTRLQWLCQQTLHGPISSAAVAQH